MASDETWRPARIEPSLEPDGGRMPEDGPWAFPEPRYVELGVLGEGGMGEVRLVRDRRLGRELAVKRLRSRLAGDTAMLMRFLEEARVTAQLQHPGIVPVHDLWLDGDVLMYAMKRVEGRTLGDIQDAWRADEPGWSLRRVVDLFTRAAEAVAYAHARGVVHRDLKPDNVMIGAFGEVQVVDWGLALVQHAPAREAPIESLRDTPEVELTRAGSIAGTAAYMAPEQAAGEQVGPAADVWALGAMLFELLSGERPYERSTAAEVLGLLLLGAEIDFHRCDGQHPELVEICRRALEHDPALRWPDAGALAMALTAWLDGARRREQALAIVSGAVDRFPRILKLRTRARYLQQQAEDALSVVPAHAPASEKRDGWRLEQLAATCAREAELEELRAIEQLEAALTHHPDLPEAHAELARYHRDRHEAAEAREDTREAARHELHLRRHDRSGRHTAYLAGHAALTLHTDPPGARATLHRFEERDRQLVPVPVQTLVTPLEAVQVAHGSYLVVLEAEGRVPVRYPVLLRRGEHWDGRPPGSGEPLPVELPTTLPPGTTHVAAGWYTSGGGPEGSRDSLPRRRVWLPAFAMHTLPVSHAEYLAFLNALVAADRHADASRWAPRQPGVGEELGNAFYEPADAGWRLPTEGADRIDPSWPVFGVERAAAEAFAAWRATTTGLPWRLPTELEWEKAARGVDGRRYPWGDEFDPCFCAMRHSRADGLGLAPIAHHAADVSPYGVRDLAGGVSDWLADAYHPEGPPVDATGHASPPRPGDRAGYRGGAWSYNAGQCRLDRRFVTRPMARQSNIGFRLALSI